MLEIDDGCGSSTAFLKILSVFFEILLQKRISITHYMLLASLEDGSLISNSVSSCNL